MLKSEITLGNYYDYSGQTVTAKEFFGQQVKITGLRSGQKIVKPEKLRRLSDRHQKAKPENSKQHPNNQKTLLSELELSGY